MCTVFDALISDQCGSNMGGTVQELYYAGVDDFDTFGAYKTPVSSPIDEYTITGNHTFKVGKCFRKVQLLKNTGVNNFEGGGNFSGTKNQTVSFSMPSNNKNAIALANKFANGVYPTIWLVRDNNQPAGEYYQIGSAEHPATITVTKNNGTAEGDGSILEFTISCVEPAVKIYTGTVTLTPAS